MEFGVWTKSLATLGVECLVLGVFEEGELSGEARSVDNACGGRLKKLLDRGDFAGRAGDTLLVGDLPGLSASRVLLTGLGTKKLFQRKSWRRACQSALVALARSLSRVLAVGHVERHNPAVQALLARTEPPLFIEGLRLAPFTPRSLDVDVVLDLMIHDLQIVSDLVRRPVVEIRAVGMPVVTSRIDIANARLEFEGGCVATLTASRVSPERMRKLRVFGPSLYCSVDMHARTIRARRLADGGGRTALPVNVEVPVESGDPLTRELEDFAGAVRERRDALVSGEVGRDALVLAHQVLDAIAAHRAKAGAGGARA